MRLSIGRMLVALGAALVGMLACAGGAAATFQPTLSVSSLNPVAGAFSPFILSVGRPDGQPYLAGITAELPPGLLGTLKEVPLCREARARTGTCGAGSRVGRVTASAAGGAAPLALEGTASLTGPYRGAPLGLSIALRPAPGGAAAGVALVRAAIFVDPDDGHLRVVSDRFPASSAGNPVGVRSFELAVDRPGFMFNPTSCAAQQVSVSVTATDGSTARAAAALQLGGCDSRAFRPRLALLLEGRRQMRDGGHPRLRALLDTRRRDANLRQVEVRLPLSLALDFRNANSLCGFEAGRAGRCPRRSIIGSARARTSVLSNPLAGRVYLVQGMRTTADGRQVRSLPTLLATLRGQVTLNVRARTSVQGGALVTTFEELPDAPLTRFALALEGGGDGILVVTRRENLCRGRQIARVRMEGQNGHRTGVAVRVHTPCRRA